MKYITVLLLAVFLIPFVQHVNAQSILDQLSSGVKNLTSGAGQSMNNTAEQAGQSASNAGQNMSQSMNNTAEQAGQSASNATSQNNTSSGNPLMDMLGKLMPGK